MAKPTRPAPSLIPAILALVVLIVVGYLLFADLKPSRTEHTVTPPIELEEPELEEVISDSITPAIDQQEIMAEEAETFVDKLTSKDDKNRAVTVTEEQGEFVRHDGIIALPKLEHRTTTVKELMQDKSLTADTPLTLDFTETEKHSTTLQQLDETIEDKAQIITLEHADGTITEAPLADLLGAEDVDKDAPVTVITQHQRTQQMTAGELAQSGLDPSQKVIATINRGIEELSVKDIIQSGELPDNALFYLHRVTKKDYQGLWGIIQVGLIERFRQGLELEGINPSKGPAQVVIPADADEPLPSGLSSFLGKVLHKKVESSYIYNFSTHTMGRNPNLIHPGQQLILIHFAPDELKQIYLFFAEQRNEQAQSFAVQP
ncbi:hypothetical protein [Methylophaga sp. OBS4]|uniref:hypothetical protein n=1 Tax=Methylophaga sp. OBS4 TaxID=2991935 RepID=UPI002258CDEA|nr:hypothetical protein [Methylophaga sp. OBS4]MCX4187342.1 hypothetical protein [Methylophaga sp. OBS4]